MTPGFSVDTGVVDGDACFGEPEVALHEGLSYSKALVPAG